MKNQINKMKTDKKQSIVDGMNCVLERFCNPERETFLNDQTSAFIADADGALCFDLHFYNYEDQFRIGELPWALIEKQTGLEFEDIGDASGNGTYIKCYRQKI